ncbi:hypothetical protein K9U39_01055 [Rhodoblastus acidophilus]|uniref:Uncharacterized protein n=1 Tax=Candidatus Rhodoblastus alkanivorans TaxID=2954117 RepID=A0ABS9Z3J3_9HYPH|nr:hypothetical protein [Candidatus Rhodoblastus alkanivorans]MCI4680515.1 hypothetical protein [Candidatus Rhodoblastus alkanivorans]MCI4682241.1 hypothetical protein [Candidatus Rhodoblastus alkanivorans]MDI4639543.1 hypothetical protein [Rhodoblastus acidophilus]
MTLIMTRRQFSRIPKHRTLMAIYTQDNFEQIAAAIDMEVEAIAKNAKVFEAAAQWYRLDRNSPKRTAPSVLCRKLDQIAKNARQLLKSLGVADLDEAADGPGDPQILDALILMDDHDETPLVRATQRIGRLAEIMEGVAAAAELSRRAMKAAAEVAEVGKLTVAEGNRGDRAINDWVEAMMSAYRAITGNEPATSVGGPDRPDEGIAGGPLIRFLIAAGKPLEIEFSEDAWRSRERTVLKGASLQD